MPRLRKFQPKGFEERKEFAEKIAKGKIRTSVKDERILRHICAIKAKMLIEELIPQLKEGKRVNVYSKINEYITEISFYANYPNKLKIKTIFIQYAKNRTIPYLKKLFKDLKLKKEVIENIKKILKRKREEGLKTLKDVNDFLKKHGFETISEKELESIVDEIFSPEQLLKEKMLNSAPFSLQYYPKLIKLKEYNNKNKIEEATKLLAELLNMTVSIDPAGILQIKGTFKYGKINILDINQPEAFIPTLIHEFVHYLLYKQKHKLEEKLGDKIKGAKEAYKDEFVVSALTYLYIIKKHPELFPSIPSDDFLGFSTEYSNAGKFIKTLGHKIKDNANMYRIIEMLLRISKNEHRNYEVEFKDILQMIETVW